MKVKETNLHIRRTLLNFLVQGQRLDRSLVSLDGTLIPSQGITQQTGFSGKHRLVGTKLSLQVDRAGFHWPSAWIRATISMGRPGPHPPQRHQTAADPA